VIAEKEDPLHLSACHAGMLGDNRTPVGSGRFRDRSQDSYWVLGTSFSYSFSLRSERKKRPVTCKKSHAQMSFA